MGASRFWGSLIGILAIFLIVVLWLGQTPFIKPKPFEGPYYELEQHYRNDDVQGYNGLIIKHNFDPFVLKQRGLPLSM